MTGNRRIGAAMLVAIVGLGGCSAHSAAGSGHEPPPVSQLMLTPALLPASMAGWGVSPMYHDGDIPSAGTPSCVNLFTDLTVLGVEPVAHAESQLSATDGSDLSGWTGDEVISRYAGDAADAEGVIRTIAAACAGATTPDHAGDSAVISPGPALGDDSLELSVHIGDPHNVAYIADDAIVIRSGNDLIVITQRVKSIGFGSIDPDTTRTVAAAAYAAYKAHA